MNELAIVQTEERALGAGGRPLCGRRNMSACRVRAYDKKPKRITVQTRRKAKGQLVLCACGFALRKSLSWTFGFINKQWARDVFWNKAKWNSPDIWTFADCKLENGLFRAANSGLKTYPKYHRKPTTRPRRFPSADYLGKYPKGNSRKPLIRWTGRETSCCLSALDPLMNLEPLIWYFRTRLFLGSSCSTVALRKL